MLIIGSLNVQISGDTAKSDVTFETVIEGLPGGHKAQRIHSNASERGDCECALLVRFEVYRLLDFKSSSPVESVCF